VTILSTCDVDVIDSLKNAYHLIRISRLFRGYVGGPLHDPWAAMVERHLRSLLLDAPEGSQSDDPNEKNKPGER
jgi:hypothetical protein